MIDGLDNKLLELIKDKALIEKAEGGAKQSLNESIKSDKEINVDFLGGLKKEDLIFNFDRYEYRFKENINTGEIVIRIGLYLNDISGIWHNSLIPVGYYELISDSEGNVIDDFLKMEKTKIFDFDISYYIKNLNAKMPKKYLRRNKGEYEFVTYISHAIILFLSNNYNESAWQVKRAFEYLNKKENENRMDLAYLKISKDFINSLINYLYNNGLLKVEIIEKLIEKGMIKRHVCKK